MADEKYSAPHVAIIGAGLAGISAAIALKTQLHFTNFTIYEKADDLGGTWRDNTYPGCGSDIPGHWYSLSTELNPNWSTVYVNQPEIQDYWKRLHTKYDLKPYTRYNTSFRSAEWDEEKQRYNVILQDTLTGNTMTTTAEIIISAMGGFINPAYPKDISGIENFHGDMWHSARWRHDVPLKGKRVGVIGNGCSAAQFIPEIAADPEVKVINFCRTPQWYVPKGNYRYPTWLQWIFANVPLVMRIYRICLMARADFSSVIFRKENARFAGFVRKQMIRYIKHKAPKETWDLIVPKYSPGCKRIIVDPGYLKALKQPNVALTYESIESIVKEGVRLKSGKIEPLDVIIFGTGYTLEAEDLHVKGSKGFTVHEYFASQGVPTAYLGMAMPGFPNLFTLLGPNVATGHASVIFSQEAQIQLALRLIRVIISGKASSFEIKDEVSEKYNEWLQKRLSSSVWTECQSYYRAGGEGGGKIFATFPGAVSLFWWLTKRSRWDEWNVVGGERWTAERRRRRMMMWWLAGPMALAVCGIVMRWRGLRHSSVLGGIV